MCGVVTYTCCSCMTRHHAAPPRAEEACSSGAASIPNTAVRGLTGSTDLTHSASMDSEASDSPAPSRAPVAEVFNSIRERAIAENSMVVLLQGLQGEVTTVDLRNESTARGRVVNVDAFMNVRLEDVLYRDRRGKLTELQDLFITGRNVRYVHIPDHVDIMKTMQSQLAKIHRVRNFASHGGGRKEYAKKTK
uniref:U7 snRNA-associated Sm-like protein LSm10 isoform X1 n=3 Tax=Gasterosteus aculeatus aculeatus TaxID=481459 RepID=UPI001A9803D9|nr:U7 snRNA-associated Sm-like protein LSm10 isoform X1 [Gasterosteus aculeatus aculeatus]